MAVGVVIPWRGGCPHREAALRWLRRRYEDRFPGWSVVVSEGSPDGPWIKAIAADAGIRRSQTEVIVLSDGDVWSDGVARAVEMVAAGAPWVMPQTNVLRLTPQATEEVLAGASIEAVAGKRASRLGTYTQATAGGLLVLRRETWERVPLDPRFAGYGGEDLSHRYALEVLIGRRKRLPGDLVHLWHPPQRGHGKPLSLASDRLRRRYAEARIGDSAKMRRLVDEAHARLEEARAA